MIRKGLAWGHSAASRGAAQVDIGYIANRLRRYFAPASQLQAPSSSRTMTGNRNTAISASLSANNAPDDSGIAQLINGVAVIPFSTQFGNQPIITAHPIGAPGAGTTPVLYSQALGYRSGTAPPTGAVIQSTDTSDGRYIFWHAVENFQ